MAYRGFRDRQRYAPLVNEKTGQLNEETADFIRLYAKKWREKSLYQVLLHYRAARFQDFVNLSQQVHIYNQRIVAGLNKCTRTVPFDRINTREVSSVQLGPLPIPIKKLPFRLDQIPFYDTQYMVDPANSMSRQTFAPVLLAHDDEESWDSPLQRNPSMTSCLLTYNAYKKEQACQTNWDRMGESDVIYNQNYQRDPQTVRRNQVQMNMNAYSNYNNYNNNNNSSSSNQQHGYQTWAGNRTGSRRNSLKGYAAPAPPPPPINMYRGNETMRSNQSQTQTQLSQSQQQQMQSQNRTNPSYQQRSSFVPSDPVRELQGMMRRSSMDDSEDPPFNFKAMLRKTNYPKSDSTTYAYNSISSNRNNMDSVEEQQQQRQSEQQQQSSFQAPKLRPTGRRFEEGSSTTHFGAASKFGADNNRNPTLRQQSAASVGRSFDDNEAKSFEEAGAYVEEEIAPGVTLSGYAVDI